MSQSYNQGFTLPHWSTQLFHCLKPGHRANECRAKLAGEPPKFSPTTAGKLDPGKITCYSCGKVGHKASFCPDKGSGAKVNPKVAAKRASSWRTTNEYVVRGLVGEKEFDFALDTGRRYVLFQRV